MHRLFALLLFCLLGCLPAGGTTLGLFFVYQPLHTIGTDMDSRIVIVRVPVIVNMVPEVVIGFVARPHKLLQSDLAAVEDSNLLSSLGIAVEATEAGQPDQTYLLTLDLRKMGSLEEYELREEAVVEAAIKCLRQTVEEMCREGNCQRWNLRILGREADGSRWKKYEQTFTPKPVKTRQR